MPKRSEATVPPTPAEPERAGHATGAVDELGAFAVARCARCGWEGSARRSRERARKDLRRHLDDDPGHAQQALKERPG